jgi:hypothetical protein
MSDANQFGQDIAKAYNDSVKQPSTYNGGLDQGSGPSTPNPSAKGQPKYGTHIENGLVVQDTQPYYVPYSQEQAGQTDAHSKTRADATFAKNQLDTQKRSIGTHNVSYTRSKGAIGKPAPGKKKGK